MAVVKPKNVVPCVFLLFVIVTGVKSDNTCDLEIDNMLRTILGPQENPTLQVQALRRDVLRKFQEALDRAEEEDENHYKRSFSSLAAWNNLPEHKRNLEALARAGYIKTLPDEEDPDSEYKRSIANLAKNGQLPMRNDEQKRGIEALARNGDLHPKKDMQELLDELYGKRNIGSLARNYNFPNYGKRSLSSLAKSGDLNYQNYQYKRNIGALAKGGSFPGKRNVAALLRQSDYLNGIHKQSTEMPDGREDKRNLQAIKAQYKPKFKRSTDEQNNRNKREADYYYEENSEYPSPVYQNQNILEYDDLMQDLTGVYPNTEKRFLGSVARTGWFTPSSSRNYRYTGPEKRHIGALARLGWLPSFRNVRRFNRSGRSTLDDTCREIASDGEDENNSIAKDPSLSLGDKRYLLQPAVDNILLRRMLMHPKSH